MKSTKVETKKEEKEEFDLEVAFTLWKQESKDKQEYLSGIDLNKNRMIGFYNTNKKNEKEADIRIYYTDEKGNKEEKSAVGLWKTTSKAGNEYYSGLTNENEKIIAFVGDEHQEKRPFIRAYFQKDNK